MSGEEREGEGPVWTLRHVGHAGSTNDLARKLPPWHAVIADRQSSGRGRHGRSFVSQPGGLWLSAVLPIPGGPARWTGLALAVGWALLRSLRSLGLHDARLRWPNDLMLGDRKLGGILLEQSGDDRCVVGVGINVRNRPDEEDASLAGRVVCLSERMADCPPIRELAAEVLGCVALARERMAERGLAGLADELNTMWGGPREVEIFPVEGAAVAGRLLGIDSSGALVLRLSEGGGRAFPAHSVERMVER